MEGTRHECAFGHTATAELKPILEELELALQREQIAAEAKTSSDSWQAAFATASAEADRLRSPAGKRPAAGMYSTPNNAPSAHTPTATATNKVTMHAPGSPRHNMRSGEKAGADETTAETTVGEATALLDKANVGMDSMLTEQ